MSSQSGLPRLQIQDKLLADGGVVLGFWAGKDNAPYALETTQSLEGEESAVFDGPSNSAGADLVAEGRVATVWRSDTDFDEYFITKVVRRRARGGTMEVTARPPVYRLAECGLVPEYQTTDPTGEPILTVGVGPLPLSTILTTYLINNTKINGQFPWLAVGSIASSTDITIDWSYASPQAVILAGRDALQQADGVPYDYRLVRNGTTSYGITITAA